MLIPQATVQTATPGALTLISDSVLGADASNFDIQNIPATYKHLQIIGSLRGTGAVVFENSLIRFNNDSAANYDWARAAANADTASASTTVGDTSIVGRNTGASATAGRFAGWNLWIPDYAGTVANKTLIGQIALFGDNTEANEVMDSTSGGWRSTSAISRITISPGSGNWLAGSRISLYGLG